MSLDPRAQRLLKMLAAASPKAAGETSLADRRAALDALMRLGYQTFDDVTTEQGSISGEAGPLPIRRYMPLGAGRSRADLIYVHGGGLIAGSIDSHDGVARALSRAAGCRVIAVGYRLAPEHPYPAALEDIVAAIREFAAGRQVGEAQGPLGVCGDSAGAAIAAAACQQLALEHPGLVSLQILLCPILDYALATESKREFARGYLLQEDAWQHDLGIALRQGLAADDPRVSPLRVRPAPSLPRTLIHTAEFDPMRDEGRLYAEALHQHGLEMSYTCHPGMIHLFYGLGAIFPQANTAFELIGAQIREAFGMNMRKFT